MKQHTPWTEDEYDILERFYPAGGKYLVRDMLSAQGFSRTLAAIANKAKKRNLKAPGNGRFKKGQDPHNKGKGISPETREKVKATWFRKGHSPHTTLHDGAITVRRDCSGIYYKHIRLAKNKWVMLHRYLWKQAHGPIPKGMVIRFKDGNSLNCELDNLEMVTRAEHLARNHEKDGHPAQSLCDGYVKAVLVTWRGMDEKDITPEMIDMYREQLRLKREIKKLKSDTNHD